MQRAPDLVVVEREHPKVHVRPRQRGAQHPQAERDALVLLAVKVARLRWWQLQQPARHQDIKQQAATTTEDGSRRCGREIHVLVALGYP